MFIPVVHLGHFTITQCRNCRQQLSDRHSSKSLAVSGSIPITDGRTPAVASTPITEAERRKNAARTTKKAIGISILVIGVLTAGYFATRVEDKTQQYMADPRVGDFYEWEPEMGSVSLFIIDSIGGRELYVRYNRYMVYDRMKVYDLQLMGDTAYGPRETILKKEIPLLFKKKIIHSIDRPMGIK